MNAAAEAPPVDLTDCDREPIHIPGSIQPHGVLLALREPELSVAQVSDSVRRHLGRSAEEVLGAPLAELIGPECAQAVGAALARDRPTDANPLRIVARGAPFDGIVHRHGGLAILELEPLLAQPSESTATEAALRSALRELEPVETVAELCEVVVRTVRRLTGFERVVMYRFDEDGHGEVVAEAKAEALVPYLGLRYPASDIPRQARELYLRNWLRLIPDARYSPSSLVPALRPDTGGPLDLSFSVLRSVSPVHLEYLANMGVRASMSISLVVRGGLWGLVSCGEHGGPRFVGYEVRTACQTLGRLVSLQLAALEEREAAAQREERRATREVLAEAMRTHVGDEVLEALLSFPDALLSLVNAAGAAIVGPQGVRTCGRTPPEAVLMELAAWLGERGERAPFATSALASHFGPALAVKDAASGLLTIALPGTPRRRILWFRPEMIQTVFWGGDPRKPAEATPDARVHPRRSFEKWKEEVRLRARPWSAADVDSTEELRHRAVESDLDRQLARAQRAVRLRDDIVAVVSHDLKSPLSVIQMQNAVLQSASATDERRLRAGTERIQRAVDRMSSLIDDLLDLAVVESGRFELHPRRENIGDLVDDALSIARPLAEAKHIVIVDERIESLPVDVDRDRIFQVFSNILGNAVKFTPREGTITLRGQSVGAEVWLSVEDTGPGVSAEEMKQVFDRYWQAPRTKRAGGSGLGLYIAKGIVEAHGGRIWVERAASGGARFTFALPRARGGPPGDGA